MRESILLVLSTAPGEDEAKKIARTLIEKKLAACCNIINKVRSVYLWQDSIKETEEYLLLIKTTQKNYDQLEKEIKMIHSYSVPEIIATKIESGSSAYVDWIVESTEKQGSEK